MLAHDELMSLLVYDPGTGLFRWRRLLGKSSRKIGGIAGCLNGSGYHVIGIRKTSYRAHRLAWLYVTGNWPTNEIDHINGIRNDNRFCNLREATSAQNKWNNDGLGYYFSKSRLKWCAQITIGGKIHGLGRFDSKIEARAAYLAACEKYHGKDWMSRRVV